MNVMLSVSLSPPGHPGFRLYARLLIAGLTRREFRTSGMFIQSGFAAGGLSLNPIRAASRSAFSLTQLSGSFA